MGSEIFLMTASPRNEQSSADHDDAFLQALLTITATIAMNDEVVYTTPTPLHAPIKGISLL